MGHGFPGQEPSNQTNIDFREEGLARAERVGAGVAPWSLLADSE